MRRGDVGLRLVALWKFAKCVLLVIAAWSLRPHATATGEPTPLERLLGGSSAPAWLHFVRAHLDAATAQAILKWTWLVAAGDALSNLAQGVGLWLGRRWGAWLTVAATSLLIPPQVVMLAQHPHWARAAVLLANIAIVAYLGRRVRRDLSAPSHVPDRP